MFLTLPDPAEFPDYYDAISQPRSISLLLERLYGTHYHRLDVFHADVLLMFRNARQYNEPSSQVRLPNNNYNILCASRAVSFVYVNTFTSNINLGLSRLDSAAATVHLEPCSASS